MRLSILHYRIAHYRFLNFESFQIILFSFFVITCIRIQRVLIIGPWKMRFDLGDQSSVRFGVNGKSVIITWLDGFHVREILVWGSSEVNSKAASVVFQ
jgi:hypothetical protein